MMTFQKGNTLGNRFRKGYTPWNKGFTGTKGFPCTEERKKQVALTHKGNTYRRNKGKVIMKGGYKVIKRNGKYHRIHHLVWLEHMQLHRIPTGCIIHHINGIKLDNSIGNLQLLDNATHTKLHKGGKKRWQE